MKILAIDVETAPNLVYTWGLFNQNIALNQIVKPSYMLCYAAQWVGSNKVIFDSIHKTSWKVMIKRLRDLLEEADIVIHYNGDSFDLPTINKEFFKAKLTPPKPYKSVDLLKTARNKFRFTSNKLEFVSKEAGIGNKIANLGFPLWVGCMNGDKTSWSEMEKYNKQDTKLLISLYKEMMPWISKHPLASLSEVACTNCGGDNVISKGTRTTKTGKYRRYVCNDCGTNLIGEKLAKFKPKYKQDT
jgi:DNA polymerase elongation subunit (family B)